MSDCNFNYGQRLSDNNASSIQLRYVNVSNFKQIINVNYQSHLSMWYSNFTNSDTLFILKNSSVISTFGGEFSDFNIGFLVNKNDPNLVGSSSYSTYNTKLNSFQSKEQQL